MDLTDYRKQIDEVDKALVELFLRRMDIAAGIAEFKKANGLPVPDSSREAAKLQNICESAPEEMRGYLRELYSRIFELSRAHQAGILESPNGEK